MSEVRITEYKEKKCRLSKDQMDEYIQAKDEFYDALHKTYKVLDKLRTFEEKNNIRWEEDKAEVAKAFGFLLQMTSAGGKSNHIKEMVYEKTDKGEEYVYPILADGTDDWYNIYVTGDSGVAMIMDITNQFVRKAW